MAPTSKARSPVNRSWYTGNIGQFLKTPDVQVLGELNRSSSFDISQAQRDAWLAQFPVLRKALAGVCGKLYLEFEIPRMGHRVDAIVLAGGLLLVIEFKIGAPDYLPSDVDQVNDYAMDLKYFHEGSHHLPVVPILVATEAPYRTIEIVPHARIEGLYNTIRTNDASIVEAVNKVVSTLDFAAIDVQEWEASRYSPTPTIVEAARALYAGHSVDDISRSDAGAINLSITSSRLEEIVDETRRLRRKSICFVTGVPGAGKTLVGLNIATKYSDPANELHSVFLSGNGPLVAILREALARDTVRREAERQRRIRKYEAVTRVKAFIQNVHHFRDECLRDMDRPPVDHLALFDEAQRAWDVEQTSAFMRRKKGRPDFDISEPEFLISCMDRHEDWSAIVCLVGGGQEINTGEAGISEWIQALKKPEYADWRLFISPALTDSEYAAGKVIESLSGRPNVHFIDELHLGVSVRSFRSEKVARFVKLLLDCDATGARSVLSEIGDRYPIVITRDLSTAKKWLREQASGSERYGIVVSSKAERLKPYAIDVRYKVDPVKWFLDGKDDVRSSYYLEDVASEYDVQGLELDWTCVSWDGDFRYHRHNWQHYQFKGSKWQNINRDSRQVYLKNAYRVLLTRERQGMVIFVPEGSTSDPTRRPEYYDSTYEYLTSAGIPCLDH